MGWDADATKVDKVLVIRFSGNPGSGDVLDMVMRYKALVTEHNADRILVDQRDLEARLSIVDTFFTMKSINVEHLPPLDAVVKIALLDHETNREYGEFHETAAANLGFRFRYFFDYDGALAWLSE